MEQHNKIISEVAKKILKPEGLFRVGSSRSWIDDNDYFLINVDFEPSGFDKGSYLNVAISFLWEHTKDLNTVCAYDFGGRVIVGKGKQYVEYRPRLKNCDELFNSEIEEFANVALLKVREYRQFKNLEFAKDMLKRKVKKTRNDSLFWELYDLSMLCFLKGDYEDGKKYFEDYLTLLKNSFCIKWHEDFYNYCLDNILLEIQSAEKAKRMVFDMINRRRSYFNSKSSYKKLKKDFQL